MRKGDAVAALGAIEDQLDVEAREDESARRQYGSRWPLAASHVASGELRDRLGAYRQGPPSAPAQSRCPPNHVSTTSYQPPNVHLSVAVISTCNWSECCSAHSRERRSRVRLKGTDSSA